MTISFMKRRTTIAQFRTCVVYNQPLQVEQKIVVSSVAAWGAQN